MSVLTLNVDEVMRTLSAKSSNPFVVHDKEVDIVRFAINSGFADIVLDGQVALRVMYQRPGESEVRAQTLTYYDTDGLHNYYDWQLSQSDLAKNGSLMVALCILDISGGEVSEWHTTPCVVRVLSTIHTDDSDEGGDTITPTVKERVAVLESMIQRVASGAPIVVASTSAMTDTDQIYVLKTDGKWYYHNGSSWVAGGEYGAVSTDTTLTQPGIPADAEAVGDAIGELKNGLTLESKGTAELTSDVIIQGTYNRSGGTVANDTRIRTKGFIPVHKGEHIEFVSGTNTQQMFYGKFDSAHAFISDGSWINSKELIIGWDGYIILAFRKSDNSVIAPSEYDANIKFVSFTNSEVDGLRNKLKYSTDFHQIDPDESLDNYGITDKGYAVYNTNFNVYKYRVTAGDKIYVIAPEPWGGKASYVFMDDINISQTSIEHLVGAPVITAVNDAVEVPADATYIMLSRLKTDTESGVYTSLPYKNSDEIKAANKKIYGFTSDVNKARADDGKSYGSTKFNFPVFAGQKITITNNQAGDNAWTCSIRSDNGTTLESFQVAKGETLAHIVRAEGASYFSVYQNAYPLVGNISAESVVEHNYRMIEDFSGFTGNTTDIVRLNYKVDDLIKSAKKPTYGQTTVPLSLLHFSDTHGASTNVKRMIKMAVALDDMIDDVICTGDMVQNKYTDGFAWWGEIDGAEKILTCIGNHDVSDGISYTSYCITKEEAYSTYFEPYIEGWDVVHSGLATYYYKDYPAKKIRLIVLDYLLTDEDADLQNSWLQSALEGARNNGYTVVIAQHCQMSDFENIDSNFTMIYKHTSYKYPVIYQASVQSFIDNGGEFACYLAGHTHWDMLCRNPEYPDQICICVTCAITTGRDNDQIRETGTKSQDAGNVVIIDTTSKTIKLIRVGADVDSYLRPRNTLSISYKDKKIITQG